MYILLQVPLPVIPVPGITHMMCRQNGILLFLQLYHESTNSIIYQKGSAYV